MMKKSTNYAVVERIMYQPFYVGEVIFKGSAKECDKRRKALNKKVNDPNGYFVAQTNLKIGQTLKR